MAAVPVASANLATQHLQDEDYETIETLFHFHADGTLDINYEQFRALMVRLHLLLHCSVRAAG